MRVTPGGGGGRALDRRPPRCGPDSRGRAPTPSSGGWKEPGLVADRSRAPRAQTWSILTLSSRIATPESAQSRARARRTSAVRSTGPDRDRRLLRRGDVCADARASRTASSFRRSWPSPPAASSAGEQAGVPRVFVSHGTLDDVLPIAEAAATRSCASFAKRGIGSPTGGSVGGHEVSTATSAAAIRWFLAGPSRPRECSSVTVPLSCLRPASARRARSHRRRRR